MLKSDLCLNHSIQSIPHRYVLWCDTSTTLVKRISIYLIETQDIFASPNQLPVQTGLIWPNQTTHSKSDKEKSPKNRKKKKNSSEKLNYTSNRRRRTRPTPLPTSELTADPQVNGNEPGREPGVSSCIVSSATDRQGM